MFSHLLLLVSVLSSLFYFTYISNIKIWFCLHLRLICRIAICRCIYAFVIAIQFEWLLLKHVAYVSPVHLLLPPHVMYYINNIHCICIFVCLNVVNWGLIVNFWSNFLVVIHLLFRKIVNLRNPFLAIHSTQQLFMQTLAEKVNVLF